MLYRIVTESYLNTFIILYCLGPLLSSLNERGCVCISVCLSVCFSERLLLDELWTCDLIWMIFVVGRGVTTEQSISFRRRSKSYRNVCNYEKPSCLTLAFGIGRQGKWWWSSVMCGYVKWLVLCGGAESVPVRLCDSQHHRDDSGWDRVQRYLPRERTGAVLRRRPHHSPHLSLSHAHRPHEPSGKIFLMTRKPSGLSWLFLRATARSANRALAIVILPVLVSRPGTDSSAAGIETPGIHRMIA